MVSGNISGEKVAINNQTSVNPPAKEKKNRQKRQDPIDADDSKLRNPVKPLATSRIKIFVCYSHDDVKWFKRLQKHLKLLENESQCDRSS
jgi:hypothetical protein